MTSPSQRAFGRNRGGVSLGRIAGVPVSLGWTSLVLLFFVASIGQANAKAVLPQPSPGSTLLLGLAFSAGVLLSLVAHEVGHCVVGRRLGRVPLAIRFEGVGGESTFGRAAERPREELLVAIAGPLVNAALAAVLYLGLSFFHARPARLIIVELLIANLTLAIFNALPGLPLDGGRVVMATVWAFSRNRALATRVGAYSGFAVAGLVAVVAFRGAKAGQGATLYSLLVVLILVQGARQALRVADFTQVLPTVVAGDLVRSFFQTDGDLPLSEALRRADEAGTETVVMGDHLGVPVALMSMHAALETPEKRRPWVQLSSVCRAIAPELVLQRSLAGEELLAAIRRSPSTEYLVASEDGDIVGVLQAVDVFRSLAPTASR